MFLTVLNPHGEITSMALTDLPVWMLELRATRYHQPKPEGEGAPNEGRTLALGIVSVVSGALTFIPIAGIDLVLATGEVGSIAADGFSKGSPAANKESLRDRLGMLHNGASQSASQVDELIPKASGLADVHASILKALWGTQQGIDQSAGILLKGEFEGWRYAITRTRFEAVFTPSLAAAEGMGTVPGLSLGGRPPPPTEAPARGGSRRKAPVTNANTAADPGKPDPADTEPEELRPPQPE